MWEASVHRFMKYRNIHQQTSKLVTLWLNSTSKDYLYFKQVMKYELWCHELLWQYASNGDTVPLPLIIYRGGAVGSVSHRFHCCSCVVTVVTPSFPLGINNFLSLSIYYYHLTAPASLVQPPMSLTRVKQLMKMNYEINELLITF